MTQVIRWVAAGVALAAGVSWAALPEVSAEAVEALGYTAGIPQASGFVFVDGKYLPPPYTVTRRGNGIFINRIQVVQPVPWVGAATGEPKKIVDEDGDFEVVEPEEKEEAEEAEEVADDKDDLLFGDAGGGKKEVHAIDALFDDTPPPPKRREPEQRKPSVAQPTSTTASKQQVEELKVKLDTLRKNYEIALGRGDIYFFSDGRSRMNGTYGTARTLFAVLPSALRNSRTPQELLARLNQGGVSFLDLAACAELHKNRMTIMQPAEDRWKQIEAAEAARRTATPGAGRR